MVLSAANTDPSTTYKAKIEDGISLLQNVPNPFRETTTIEYILPQTFTKAQLIITDKNGKKLLVKDVSGLGKGRLNIDAKTLASGAYQYSLQIDNKTIDTRQMLLLK